MVKGKKKKKVGEEDHNWLKGVFFSCEVFANAMIGATKQRGIAHVAFFVDQGPPGHDIGQADTVCCKVGNMTYQLYDGLVERVKARINTIYFIPVPVRGGQ